MIWITMCVYLMIAFLKLQSKVSKNMQQTIRELQLNLFEKRDLMALLRGDPMHHKHYNPNQFFALKVNGTAVIFFSNSC